MNPAEVQAILDRHAYEAARSAPPDGFPQLPDIPRERYVDPAFAELEKRHLWHKSWVYAIHGDEVPKPGSYMQWTRLGEPLFFIRGEDGKVRCFYNVCRHRGAPVVTEERGESRGVSCKYHGWTYNTRGELVNLRDRRDFVDLDLSCRSLNEVRCEGLGNLYFINLDPAAPPLREALGQAGDAIMEMKPETLIFVEKTAIKVACNVKILLDAFLEVYHLKSIHQNTVDRFLDHRGSAIALWPQGHSRMVTPFKKQGWLDPGVRGLPEIEGVDPYIGTTNMSILAYPNLVTPLAPQGMPFLCFWPETIDTMVIEVHWFSPSWGEGPRPAIWDTRLSNFLAILDEDLQFADHIQKSVESNGVKGFPLNYQERRIYHWHEELDRRIGAERIAPDMRVPEMLGGWVDAPAEVRPALVPA